MKTVPSVQSSVSTSQIAIGGGTRKRNQTIDLVKGIGIILMVLRHARAPYSDFVLLFHMAIFFIASGYLLNLKYAEDLSSLWKFIKKKLKGLWLPFAGFNTAYVIVNNVFIHWNIYTDNPAFASNTFVEKEYVTLAEPYGISKTIKEIIKVILFQGGTQLGGALWFFNTLFFLLVGYICIQYLLNRILKSNRSLTIAQTVVSILFLAVGYYCSVKGISAHGLNRVLSYYWLIHFGVLIKEYDLQRKIRLKPIVQVIFSITILLICYHRGSINLAGNEYTNPIFFLIASVSGWILLYSSTTILEKYLGKNSKVNRAIQYISIHSVPIIGLHFLAFKIVNAIAVSVYAMPFYMIAAFPVLMRTGAWWLLYTFIGITFPLLADWVWVKGKSAIVK